MEKKKKSLEDKFRRSWETEVVFQRANVVLEVERREQSMNLSLGLVTSSVVKTPKTTSNGTASGESLEF